MKLQSILENIDIDLVQGSLDQEINNLEYDSRKVLSGDAFFCIEGYKTDGHYYIEKAIKQGAKVIIDTKDINELKKIVNIATAKDATLIRVKDARKALAVASSNFYKRPAEKMKIIGVTGTNGKTTITFMLKSIFEQIGKKISLLGTIYNQILDDKIPSQRTTLESLELQKLFSEMAEKAVDYCFMEVSSHSLYLDRVYGIEFKHGIFTNLTRDHLDFHKTFENYFNSKLILFKNSQNCVINIDDEYGRRIISEINSPYITYAVNQHADLFASNLINSPKGIKFDLNYKGNSYEIKLNLPGVYNVYNALACAAVCISEGINIEDIAEGFQDVTVPGRCELVTKGYELGYEIIIDYAHTPDGLENILRTVKEFTKGRLIVVFGCGGDRDKEKRPIMGDIGTKLSDMAIITSDNPRTEDPNQIISDIVSGINSNNYMVIADRKTAIFEAVKIAKKDDVIVIAGKGHEDYQILKDKTIHFDEREVIHDALLNK